MGTNYYAKINPCPHCGRAEKEIHLGKSSAGWKFIFQANGFEYYKDWKEMQEWLKDKEIRDEYGEKVEYGEFVKWVETCQKLDDPEEPDYGSQMYIIDGYKFYNTEFY